MKANKKSSQRVNPEAGTHIAQVVAVLDWGTVTDSFGSRRKVEVLFELPESTHEFNEGEGEVPLIVDRKYALTIGRNSALKELIEGFTGQEAGEEFELEDLLGKVGQIQIALKKDGEYTNVEINSYMQLSKNDQKRKFKPHNELKMLDLDNFDKEVFDSLPEWKRNKIAESPEYKEMMEQEASKPAKKPAAAPAKGKTNAGALFDNKKGKR